MIKIKNEIEHATIIKACDLVMKHYQDMEFHKELIKIQSFNHTTDNGFKVSGKILSAEIEIFIKPYTTWKSWSKVIGYAEGNTIYCNTRKLNLPLRDRVSNIKHESLHLMGYSHKGNYNNDYNRGTVPYKVADLFADYVMGLQ
jgi:hypothetical protein